MNTEFTQAFDDFLEKVKGLSIADREICVVQLMNDDANYFVRLNIEKGRLNLLSIYKGALGFESLMDHFGVIERPDVLQRAHHYVIYREENLENVPPDVIEFSRAYSIENFEGAKDFLFLNKLRGQLERPLSEDDFNVITQVINVLIKGNLNQIKWIKKIGYDQKFTHFTEKESGVTVRKKRIEFNYPRFKGNEFKVYGVKKKCQPISDYWFITDTFMQETFFDEDLGYEAPSFLRSIVLLSDDGVIQEHDEISYKEAYLKSVLKVIEDFMEAIEVRPQFIITDHRPLAQGLKDFLNLYDITLIYDAHHPVLVHYRDAFMAMMAEEDYEMDDEILFSAYLKGQNIIPADLEAMTKEAVEDLISRFEHRIEVITEGLLVRMEKDEFSHVHPEDIEDVIFDEMMDILLKGE